MAKKWLVIVYLFTFIVWLVGCGAEQTIDNPFGINDPNAIQAWADFVITVGQSAQAGGIATGNPVLIGYGVLLVIATGLVTNIILKKGKENNGA